MVTEIVDFLNKEAEMDCIYELETKGFTIIDDGENWEKSLDCECSRAIVFKDDKYYGISRKRRDMYFGYINKKVDTEDVYEVIPFEKTITCYRKKSESL